MANHRSDRRRYRHRPLRTERLETRQLLAGDVVSLHNADSPSDVNRDGSVTPVDALNVINYVAQQISAESESSASNTPFMVDVNGDGDVTAQDALQVINDLVFEPEMIPEGIAALPDPLNYGLFPKATGVDSDFAATFNSAIKRNATANVLNQQDVQTLLDRASAATRSTDGIIAVVDRNGTILGVRVEEDVAASLKSDQASLAYAIDGAVAKARTAAFFSSNSAPLTSRTIRSLSQSTITQREVESSPVANDDRFFGPGFVGTIGVGGKFPPEVNFTPQVDLFAIEHQSRDSQIHPGSNGRKGDADDFALRTRFNANPTHIPTNAEEFFQTWPEAYGVQTQLALNSQSRGVATLPGGIPLFKLVSDAAGNPFSGPLSESINLVGGIGVFYPGEDGYASFEQGFENGNGASEKSRTNAARVLEAEFAAFIAAAGGGVFSPNQNFQRDVSEFNNQLPPLPNFIVPNGRIDLVGITLEIFGPNPTREHRIPGIDRLIQVGRANFGGVGNISGDLEPVDFEKLADGTNDFTKPQLLKDGRPVPEEWLVAPHDSAVDPGLTADVVQEIIENGITEANRTRAAIRLDIDNGFKPGAKTRMVLAVTDTTGELLGLYRMPDATIFSIDVSVAKARNVAYYADPDALEPQDRVDFNGDGVFGSVSTSLNDFSGDTLPLGTALTNRTIRFLSEPRYPTGQELPVGGDAGLVSDPNLDLCDQNASLCQKVAPQSILRTPGINPITAENLPQVVGGVIDNFDPLSADVYSDDDTLSVLAFDAFNQSRNFRDPGDDSVVINGSSGNVKQPLANQNGIVFFPGSTPLYLNNDPDQLVGGFGVSGDGVDQDDVVTSAGQVGFAAPASIRVDQFPVAGVRLPFQKFNRNPFGG